MKALLFLFNLTLGMPESADDWLAQAEFATMEECETAAALIIDDNPDASLLIICQPQ